MFEHYDQILDCEHVLHTKPELALSIMYHTHEAFRRHSATSTPVNIRGKKISDRKRDVYENNYGHNLPERVILFIHQSRIRNNLIFNAGREAKVEVISLVSTFN